MSLDGCSMHALVKELSRALVGGRIDKITQPNKQTIVLSVRQPGRNYLLHITTNPRIPPRTFSRNRSRTRRSRPSSAWYSENRSRPAASPR